MGRIWKFLGEGATACWLPQCFWSSPSKHAGEVRPGTFTRRVRKRSERHSRQIFKRICWREKKKKDITSISFQPTLSIRRRREKGFSDWSNDSKWVNIRKCKKLVWVLKLKEFTFIIIYLFIYFITNTLTVSFRRKERFMLVVLKVNCV